MELRWRSPLLWEAAKSLANPTDRMAKSLGARYGCAGAFRALHLEGIPFLHRINRRSRQSVVVTVVGTLAMLLGVVISFAFASELLRFGMGMIAVFGGILELVGILVWLFTTNVLAWRGRALPRNLALLGMAAAITITLLYPVWALWLAVILRRQAAVRGSM